MAGYAFGVLPWMVPGVLLAALVAVPVSGPLGRRLHVERRVMWLILVSFGLTIAATMTPVRGNLGGGEVWTGACDLSRVGLASVSRLTRVGDTSLNVALFVPLGIAVGLVAGRRPRTTLILAGIALPFIIEGIQLTVPVIDRGCQSADVFDNLTGLVLGLFVGSSLRWAFAGPASRAGHP